MKRSVNRWITLCFMAVLAVTVLVSAGWNLFSTSQAILNVEETSARSCAGLIAGLLDHYGTDALLSRSDEGLYRHLRNSIRSFCQGFRQDHIILYTVSPDDRVPKSMLVVAADNETDGLLVSGERPDISHDIPQSVIDEALQVGSGSIIRQRNRLEVQWYVPYRNSSVSDTVIICMQSSIFLEDKLILRDFLMDILLPASALIVIFLILLFLIKRRIIHPLRAISDSMNRFARDSRQKPEPLNIPYRDEIGEIAESFEKMTTDISSYVNNIESLTRDKVENNVQLDVARRIQNGLVPEQCTLDVGDFRIRATTRPAKAVGGDFYDCFRLGETGVCVFMGDVSGKGVSAAIFMAVAKTLIREKLMAGLSPAEALIRTNSELYAQNPEGLFATVFAAILDTKTGELRYANAGHTVPVLLKKESSFLRPDSGIALGLFEDADILDESLTLTRGEALLLYTDGITEAVNPQNEFFGTERLLETVSGLPEEGFTADDVIRRIIAAVGAFCDGSEPFDDMAVLVLLRGAAPADPSCRTLPVSLSSFDEIKADVFRAAGNTPETRKALLACDEALANIVRHSGAKTLGFSCWVQDHELSVTFSDDGVPFDPAEALAEEKEFEQLDGGGMGLNIIRQSAAAVSFGRKNGRNELTMRFRLES